MQRLQNALYVSPNVSHSVGPEPKPVVASAVQMSITPIYKLTPRVKIVLHKKNLRLLTRYIYQTVYPLASRQYNENQMLLIVKYFLYMLIMYEDEPVICERILSVFSGIGVPPGLLHIARIICSKQSFITVGSVIIQYVVDEEWDQDIKVRYSIQNLISALESQITNFHYIKTTYQDWSKIQSMPFRISGIFEEMFSKQTVIVDVKLPTSEETEEVLPTEKTIIKMNELLNFSYRYLALDTTQIDTLFLLLFMPSCADARNSNSISFWGTIPYQATDVSYSDMQEILIACLKEYFKRDSPTNTKFRFQTTDSKDNPNMITPHDRQLQDVKRAEKAAADSAKPATENNSIVKIVRNPKAIGRAISRLKNDLMNLIDDRVSNLLGRHHHLQLE